MTFRFQSRCWQVPSVEVEAKRDAQGVSADIWEVDTITVDSIVSDTPRVKLAQLIVADPTLNTARLLADKQAEGYHWEDSLLFRSTLDECGVNYKQLCLPNLYRSKCLELCHEKFGHLGRNKMMSHQKKLFYWPSISIDVATHVMFVRNIQNTIPKSFQCKRGKF